MDAFLIRMAVVPALMFMFGKANWWFPGWLDRILPRLSVDPELSAGATARAVPVTPPIRPESPAAAGPSRTAARLR